MPFVPPSSPWQRLRALPPPERALAWRLALALPLIDLSLRLFGFQRTWRWLARCLPRASRPGSANAPSALRTAALARAVGARSPWRTTCLRQSLAVWWLLRERGQRAILTIGVVRREQPLQAHAWVELDGVALDPEVPPDAVFPPLPEP
ncbi:MAG: lasso peptide biosynthesis B2 protein [Xanthomonadales bacterium]|nr:lasso peptide biosynthesis B2 protein [Xanthomonadales bacterium]